MTYETYQLIGLIVALICTLVMMWSIFSLDGENKKLKSENENWEFRASQRFKEDCQSLITQWEVATSAAKLERERDELREECDDMRANCIEQNDKIVALKNQLTNLKVELSKEVEIRTQAASYLRNLLLDDTVAANYPYFRKMVFNQMQMLREEPARAAKEAALAEWSGNVSEEGFDPNREFWDPNASTISLDPLGGECTCGPDEGCSDCPDEPDPAGKIHPDPLTSVKMKIARAAAEGRYYEVIEICDEEFEAIKL